MSTPKERYKPEKGGMPFREELTEVSASGRIRELVNLKDKVVRVEFQGDLTTEGAIEKLNNIKAFFGELKNRYGITTPGIDAVIGKDENGRNTIFMIVDRIEGKNLKDEKILPIESSEKIDDFFERLLQSWMDAYAERKPFLWDVQLGNLTYGHKATDKEDRIYFHDVEPLSIGERFYYSNRQFILKVEHILKIIEDVEKKFSDHALLMKARKKTEEILKFLENEKKPRHK